MDFPRSIKIHPSDNVAIVSNAGGLNKGAIFGDGDAAHGVELMDHTSLLWSICLLDPPFFATTFALDVLKKTLQKVRGSTRT